MYDVVLDSLKLNTVDIDHVRRTFGPNRDGNGLARWASVMWWSSPCAVGAA